VITAKNLGKTFKLYPSPAYRLKEIILRKPYHQNYQALVDVSFTLNKGETLGILGPNGAGKSTLLKMLVGVLLSDKGSLHIEGRVTGLLELGTGFNPELSGRANIAMNGMLLGMTQEEVVAKEAQIIEFAELGIFIDEPLKTYSSGMVMRLAFAIAINADPACFIIDEALSVGDAGFQQKCMRRIREFKQQGGAIVFVSHDMNAVKQLCDRAILLNKGLVVAAGEPDDIVNQYNRLLSDQMGSENEVELQDGKQSSFGTLDAKIGAITINDSSQSVVLPSGATTTIVVEVESFVEMDKLSVGFIIRDKYGQDVYGTNSYFQGQELRIRPDGRYRVAFTMDMNIGAGSYTIGAAIHTMPPQEHITLNWVDNAIGFEVLAETQQRFDGICRLHPKVSIS